MSDESGGEQEILELTPGTEVKLPNPFFEPLPDIPTEVEGSFPAVTHYFSRGVDNIRDKGWLVKWYDTAEKAEIERDKSRAEAGSISLTKEFIESLRGLEERKPLEILFPNIPTMLNRDEIMLYGGVGKYEFRPRSELVTYEGGSRAGKTFGDRIAGDPHKIFHDFLVLDVGSEKVLAIAQEYGFRHPGSNYDVRRFYYDIAIKNGTTPEVLDQEMLRFYNSGVAQIKQELAGQLEGLDLRFLEDYDKLPKLAGELLSIRLREAVAEFKKLVEEDGSVQTIEDFWEATTPTRYARAVEDLNSEFTKWDELWGGSFGLFTEQAKKGEILVNYGGHFRRMGGANNQDSWVIRPNGDRRPPTLVKYRGDYFGEGEKTWDMVVPDEVAVSWLKPNTGATHTFKIDKAPPEGLTEAQKASLKTIQDELESEWHGRTGISGKVSPSVGSGWLGLLDVAVAPKKLEIASEDKTPDDDETFQRKLAEFQGMYSKKQKRK